MTLVFPIEPMRQICADTVTAFSAAADRLSEYELLGASRCHGWTRLDVVVHVINGWHEMLGGLVSTTDSAPTVDAASFWSAFGADQEAGDPLDALMAQRRRTASYSRPSAALAHLHDVEAMLLRGIETMADGARLWLGHVFTAADFLAVWAVEHVIHQLDLVEPTPPPPAGLAATRQTIEALAGGSLPSEWSDADVALIGSGRLPVPPDARRFADRIPVIR